MTQLRNFMVLTRATQVGNHEAGQCRHALHRPEPNLRLASVASVFLRAYTVGRDGNLHSTGALLSGGDGKMATWADLKQNAVTALGHQVVGC